MLDWIAALPTTDEVAQVVEYRDFVTKLPLAQAAQVVRQCWMNTTYDKPNAPRLNRIAFRFEGQVIVDNLTLPTDFLLSRILSSQPGAMLKGGPPPRLPAERRVRESLRSLLGRRR